MATFSDLPTEMKAAVFAYIRQNRHRRAVCLVSREFRDVMSPLLWKTLKLREATTLPGDLASLLSADNRVLAHVRIIDIYTEMKGDVDFDPNSEFGLVVRLIIGALTKNCLTGIIIGIRIKMSIVLSLLQNQQSLEVLWLRTIIPDQGTALNMSLATHGSWVTRTLQNIRKLRIPISVENTHAYENSEYLLKNTPNLRTLCLKGTSKVTSLLDHSNGNDVFGGPYTEEAVDSTLQLKTLHLLWLDFTPYPASLLKCVEFPNIRNLSISQCRNIAAFLTALVAAVPQATALRELEVSMRSKPVPLDTDIQAMEALVSSAPFLEKVWLDVGTGRAVDVSCLSGNGKSLRQLTLAASSKIQPPAYYTISELGKLIDQTPKLEMLAVNLCPVRLGSARYLAANFKLPAQEHDEVTSYLVCIYSQVEKCYSQKTQECIARHRNLKSLRAITVPSIDFGIVPNPSYQDRIALPEDYVQISRVMMQTFAKEVIRYLAQRGSKIRTMVISPDSITGMTRPTRDENGHIWPRYFYTYGIARNIHGEEHVVAVPAKMRDVEFCERATR